LLVVGILVGCTSTEPTVQEVEELGEDGVAVALEGSEIVDQLDTDRVSQAFTSEVTFERLGIMWDAPDSASLQLRFSSDASTWSEWSAPTVVYDENGSFAGHVDVPEGALYFQYRVDSLERAPTWVTIDTIEQIPPTIEAEPDSDLGTAQEELKASDIPIHSRASWGARKPQCSGGKNSAITRATIHHTVTPTNDSFGPKKRLRQIQAFHMFTRGWCDIGYNYLVSRDGRIWTGRGKNVTGAHVSNANTNNVGISFMGNYMGVKANKAQRCKSAKLLRWLHQKHPALKLRRTDVKGHRQLGSTSCPGDKLYNQIAPILKIARGGACQ
jgi:hypothetical protein